MLLKLVSAWGSPLTRHRQRIAALSNGLWADIPALRRGCTRLLIEEVLVEDRQVHIRGSRKALERVVIATAADSRTKVPS